MKIEIPDNCIIINGVCYEMVEDDNFECKGCVFEKNPQHGCFDCGYPCTNIFGNERGKFLKKEIVTNN